jgi:hypothetical protein
MHRPIQLEQGEISPNIGGCYYLWRYPNGTLMSPTVKPCLL